MAVSETSHPIEQVVAALAAASPTLKATSGGWTLTLADEYPFAVHARVVGDWLELTSPVDSCGCASAADSWGLAMVNARLSGAARMAASLRGAVFVRTELALAGDLEASDESAVDPPDIAGAVRWLCEDLRTTLDQVCGLRDRTAPRPVGRGIDGAALSELCSRAGWPTSERLPGEVVVEIDTRHAPYRVVLSRRPGDELHGIVALDGAEPATPASREASARLLLVLSGTVRMVKGVLVRDGEAVRPGIAVACAQPRSASDMARVLSAITVACDLAGRELRVLADDRLAQAYLALWRAPSAGTNAPSSQGSRFNEVPVSIPKEDLCLQPR